MIYKILTWYKHPTIKPKVVHVLEFEGRAEEANEWAFDVIRRASKNRIKFASTEVYRKRTIAGEYLLLYSYGS